MYYYAQLDGGGVCVAVTDTRGPLIGPQFVTLASYDVTRLGKTWTGTAWV